MNEEDLNYCYYSDLPSPMAYMQVEPSEQEKKLPEEDINRVIEMAWEDRTPFDVIKIQFGLNESSVKTLMKNRLKFSSYKRWRKRVEVCKTKHAKTRINSINRFKCNLQRTITSNKISKRTR